MDDSIIDGLIDSSHFIDNSLKKKCKEYFEQIPKGLGTWFYSSSIPPFIYQGDIIDKLDVAYLEVTDGDQQIQFLEDTLCVLLSNTCDMYFKGKTREKYISIAPLFSFDEFAESRYQEYSKEGWENFLADIKANRITDILYIPEKKPIRASIIPFDRIFSINPHILQERLDRNKSERILSLSQIGLYFFLIKLTHHFARYEDRTEIIRK